MELTELRERIARWEDLHTEFKEWPVHKDKLAAALVAFANTDGGQLVLGVSETRELVGVEDLDAASRGVDNVAYQNCEPPITVVQETLRPEASDHPVLVVNVPKGDMCPYRTNRGVYYIRTTSGRRQASREELLRLFQVTESLFYDESPMVRLSLADLDQDAFELYLRRTEQESLDSDRTRLLRNWNLFEADHPTLAGVVLFGRQPQRYLPHAKIVAARFPGSETSLEPSDRKDLDGRLFEVIDQAERFLELHLSTSHRIRGFSPETVRELPTVALREAVVNAVAHRDYTIRGPIRLFVLDHRVEIHTPGKPPNGVDEGSMRAGIHVVRNPTIYARLADAGLVARPGTGIRRIIQLVREALDQEIDLRIDDNSVTLILPRRGRRQESAPLE